MIGSFLTRGLVMVFGYAYPAYECYKTVEKNKPEIEQLRFWCQYWILVALLTVFERVGDTFISWVPMYSEAKLAFVIYLWYPKTQGTTHVYDSFFRPYVAKHETEIDRNLLELRTRAGDMAVLYCRRAATYGQTRIFEILQYVASQSTPRPRPEQPGSGARQPPAASNHQPAPAASYSDLNTASNRQPPAASNRQPPAASNRPSNSASIRQANVPTHAQTEELPSPTSSTSSNQHPKEAPEKEAPSQAPKTALPTTSLNTLKAIASSETTIQSTPVESEEMEIDTVTSPANENVNPPPKETVMEESIQVARGRLRKVRSAVPR